MLRQEVLNTEQCQDLERIMNLKYAAHLKGRRFSIEAWKDQGQLMVRVILQNHSQSFFYPVEGVRNLASYDDLNPENGAFTIIDYIDFYFDQFFQEDEGVFIPIDWYSYTFEGLEFYLRGQILDLAKEGQADALLTQL